MSGCLQYSESSPKESMRTWKRMQRDSWRIREYAKRHKNVYISVNNNANFNFIKILFIYTI
jgi:hypothetical protein